MSAIQSCVSQDFYPGSNPGLPIETPVTFLYQVRVITIIYGEAYTDNVQDEERQSIVHGINEKEKAVMVKNRPDEVPDVPMGYRWLGFFKTRKEADEYMGRWQKQKPNQPFLRTHNRKDGWWSVWTRTTKSESKLGWRNVHIGGKVVKVR